MNRPAGLVPPSIESAAVADRRLPAVAPRGLWALAGGLVWAVAAFFNPAFLWVLVGFNVAVALAWLNDAWRLPPAAQLVVRRDWLAPLALTVPSAVRLEVASQSPRALRVDLVDTVTTALRSEPPELSGTVRPQAPMTAVYDVRPTVRGPVAVGDVYLRYRGPLGMAERWARAPLAESAVAYPNLDAARDQALRLIRTRSLDLERRAARLRGTGRLFESLRDFLDGDELRDVCWTASARRGRLTTRLYEIERSQTVWVLLDAGRLMRAREGRLSKLDHGVNAALVLAEVALGTGDRVGLITYSRHVVQRVPAARGAAHLRGLVEHLARVAEDDGEADHVQAAARLMADQRRRSLVVWITDLAETAATPEVIQAAAHLTRRHVVVFVVIGQPSLGALADRTPQTAAEMFETAAAQTLAVRRARLLASLRASGAIVVEADVAELTGRAVNAYLDVRSAGRL